MINQEINHVLDDGIKVSAKFIPPHFCQLMVGLVVYSRARTMAIEPGISGDLQYQVIP
jgi:hypothetical protein